MKAHFPTLMRNARLILLSVGLFLVFVLSIAVVVLSAEVASQAKKQAATDAIKLADLQRSPFKSVALEAVSAEGEPFRPPGSHALIVTVCGPLAFKRAAVVNRSVTAMVGRTINSEVFKENLTPGMEHFTVKNNPNQMSPKLFAASNWPRYTYLSYNTYLQAMDSLSAAYMMDDIHFYIIDYGQALPKPGELPPRGPDPHPLPQPSCPIASFTPPPSVP